MSCDLSCRHPDSTYRFLLHSRQGAWPVREGPASLRRRLQRPSAWITRSTSSWLFPPWGIYDESLCALTGIVYDDDSQKAPHSKGPTLSRGRSFTRRPFVQLVTDANVPDDRAI